MSSTSSGTTLLAGGTTSSGTPLIAGDGTTPSGTPLLAGGGTTPSGSPLIFGSGPTTLATVATTGDYNHLINRPSTPADNGAVPLNFPAGAPVANGTYRFLFPYQATVQNLIATIGSAGGSFNVSVTIAGATVGGLGGVGVSTNSGIPTPATSGAAAAAGAIGAFVISGTSTNPVPTDAFLALTFSHG